MLNDAQKDQLRQLIEFFTYVLEHKLKGNFVVNAVGNGELGGQIKFEGYYVLPKTWTEMSEEELEMMLMQR